MRALFPFLLLLSVACDEVDPAVDEAWGADNEALPTDQAPPPVIMTMVGSCPGPVTFNLSGLTPSGGYVVARSPNLAPGVPVPGGPCAGTFLRIGPPTTVATTGTASIGGTASIPVTLPPAACGTYLQPLDVATCTTGMFLQL